jgi:glutamate formiminotransferase / 5-formyltetrahydrofolate cyclo-ligase
MLECVINISEGQRSEVIDQIASSAGDDLLDVHRDGSHHRSVLTVVGEVAARAVASTAVERLDLRDHAGVHPRIGVVDVVPFVPLPGSDLADAVAARDDFAAWLAQLAQVPCFLYGPERSLPEIRRRAFRDLAPDFGPPGPHPTAGATAVGARRVLVAYNLWLADPDLDVARRLARQLRGPAVRALAFPVGDDVQVSMNLVDPESVGPADVYDAVAAVTDIARAELVGLVPEAVRARIPRPRWEQLDLAGDKTIDARLRDRGSGRA